MAPIMTNPVMMIGTTQLVIILVIVVVLFGGAKLAGLGKSMGSAIREFKHETKGLGSDEGDQQSEVVDAEVVEPEGQQQSTPQQMNSSAPNQTRGAAQQQETEERANPSGGQ